MSGSGRADHGRLAAAAVAVTAAATVEHALPAGPTPALWHGLGGTSIRLSGAALLGLLSCLLLASLLHPRRLMACLRMLRTGLCVKIVGRTRLIGNAVTEEAVWRGCALVFFATAFGTWAGVVISSAAFGLWHAHQGGVGIIANAVNGTVFGLSFLMLGGLPASAITHAAHNLTLAPIVIGRQRLRSACDQNQDRQR